MAPAVTPTASPSGNGGKEWSWALRKLAVDGERRPEGQEGGARRRRSPPLGAVAVSSRDRRRARPRAGGPAIRRTRTMATTAVPAGSAHAEYNPARLFIISCLSLATGGLVFSLFSNIMAPVGQTFHLDGAQLGGTVGTWALGLALALGFGSILLDTLGMGRVLGLACVLQVVGVSLTIFSPQLQSVMPPMLCLSLG